MNCLMKGWFKACTVWGWHGRRHHWTGKEGKPTLPDLTRLQLFFCISNVVAQVSHVVF